MHHRTCSVLNIATRKFLYRDLVLGTLTLYTGGSVWLKKWSENNSKHGGNPEVGKYIGIYFAFGIGSAALVVMQTLILWIFCSIEVSTQGFTLSVTYDTSFRCMMSRPAWQWELRQTRDERS